MSILTLLTLISSLNLGAWFDGGINSSFKTKNTKFLYFRILYLSHLHIMYVCLS